MSVRVRYAPSPTGSPHVGNIRDALFKFLFAKHHNGTNIVRIEDTDRTRYIPGSEQDIFNSLRWLGIEWQEGMEVGGPFGPYRQSERKELGIYDKHIQVLLDSGYAYWAFDTTEELTEMREFQQVNKQPIGYFGGMWRDASSDAVEKAKQAGKPGVIRLKVPRNEEIVIQDVIRGRIAWDSNNVDDPVLIKADGMPTYHFASMVDDHLMEITHIIRGEEWISSAPKHACLFDAFGWSRPIFVHCPVIKGKDGSKLSKRHGDTKCLDFRSAGFLPEAMVNFISLIGWAPGGDKELMSMDELVEAFDLDGLQPSPGVFDMEKLTWMNGHYIRQKDISVLTKDVLHYVKSDDTYDYWNNQDNAARADELKRMRESFEKDAPYVDETILLEQERVQTLAEFGSACEFFLVEIPNMDQKAVDKWFTKPHVPQLLNGLLEKVNSTSEMDKDACESWVRNYAAENGIEKMGMVVHPIRVALTGKTVGPGLFELMSVLGTERMKVRLQNALQNFVTVSN